MANPECPLPLRLEGELNIYTALEMKARLLEVLGRDAEPCLDLSGITEVDTAGLQLLILAHREAERQGKGLRCLEASPAVLEILTLCHLTARFGDPVTS